MSCFLKIPENTSTDKLNPDIEEDEPVEVEGVSLAVCVEWEVKSEAVEC